VGRILEKAEKPLAVNSTWHGNIPSDSR
jgi:hypothetical protein